LKAAPDHNLSKGDFEMTTTARATPVGNRLKRGFRILIAFAADPDVSIWEKTVKPPGVDGGEPVDTTTQHNVDVRTFAARVLKGITEGQSKVAYDPACYPQLIALINVETWMTVHFPDGSTVDFCGFLRTFVPAEAEEPTQPEATVTFTATNQDPDTGLEQLPVYTAAAT
jgi:hypothetical protein